jgi:hypothetical protein
MRPPPIESHAARNFPASNGTCFRRGWYTVRTIFASRMAWAFFTPRFFPLGLHPLLGRVERPEHQRGGLRGRPLQVGVPELAAAEPLDFAGALVRAQDQPGVRQEVPDVGEPADRVDRVDYVNHCQFR